MSIPLEADAVNGWVVGPVGIKPREVGKVETDLDWFSQLKGSNAFTVYTDLETAEKQLEKMRAMYPAMEWEIKQAAMVLWKGEGVKIDVRNDTNLCRHCKEPGICYRCTCDEDEDDETEEAESSD